MIADSRDIIICKIYLKDTRNSNNNFILKYEINIERTIALLSSNKY